MRVTSILAFGWIGCAFFASNTFPAAAQQITGTPGSSEATTTIDGRYLPTAAAAV